jgi:glyoxylase-like metal-dependent hydrolase (beta-lactamase superfamily II)
MPSARPSPFWINCQVVAAVLLSSAVSLDVRGAEAPLAIKVITSSAASLHTNFTLIMGKQDAVLVDAPFTHSDAHRLVADILESGKNLKTIFITHDHPDHFFSLDILAASFPNADIIAAPAVVEDIWRSIPLKLKRWGPLLGANGPKHPIAPRPIESGYFELEGQRLEILGPMQGDHVHSTALHIPALRAVICGDLVFNRIHLWFGESLAEQRRAWLESIERLSALDPLTVVAGHKVPGLPDDVQALRFTRSYLVAFEQAVARAKDSADLIAMMRREFPDTQDVIDDFILVNSAKVAMGESPPWQE